MKIKIFNDRENRSQYPKPLLFRLIGFVFLGVFVINLFPTLILKPIIYFRNSETITVEIKFKERTCYSGSHCKYLIYTDKEVLENSDSWFDGKYNSADFTNTLDSGNVCTVKVRGLRVPYFSWFRNIVEIYECEIVSR
ncbi:MAG: hypothetical protein AAGF07_01770 [Patescibacteria group bacterium]